MKYTINLSGEQDKLFNEVYNFCNRDSDLSKEQWVTSFLMHFINLLMSMIALVEKHESPSRMMQ